MHSLAREFAPQGVARELLTQQKVNLVDSRLRSAEHSSELDALLSLARELRLFVRRGRAAAYNTSADTTLMQSSIRRGAIGA